MSIYKRMVRIAGGLLSLTIISGILLSSPSASADNSVNDDISIDIPITCNLSSTVNTAHTASITAGHYLANIGKSTIKAACNDNEGFAIYAIGYSNDEYGNTNLIGTTDSTNTMPTDTITSGYTSGWAMKLTPVSGTYTPTIVGSALDSEKEQSTPDFSSYTEIPSTYTKVAYRNSNTDATTGAKLKSTYATYIASNQYAGTYEGKVKYTLVHPATESAPPQPQTTQSGKICYYPNGANVDGTMGCQNAASSVTLLASNFSRTGYGFAGWSDKFDYSTGAHFYGPNETITLTTSDYSSPNNGLSLYAVWIKSAGSMQNWEFITMPLRIMQPVIWFLRSAATRWASGLHLSRTGTGAGSALLLTVSSSQRFPIRPIRLTRRSIQTSCPRP